ncbi:MAG: restriction endonuclease subunit S, partial [Rikenellaceae bacterium]
DPILKEYILKQMKMLRLEKNNEFAIKEVYDAESFEENAKVLFNITGASVARCCIVDNALLPARVNQHVAIIRPKAGVVLPKYLMYMLIIGKEELLTIAKGATSREAITKLQLEEFAIPLATIDEQNKIVAKIEKLEAEIAKAQNVIDKAPEQKQAILKKILINERCNIKGTVV